jgi:hypothetical protein
VLSTILLVLLSAMAGAGSGAADSFVPRTLDGSSNNLVHPTWGRQECNTEESRQRTTRTGSAR